MPSKKKKYNARFPPARIKKIMQTDEEVGKVAAAVPVIISRALELFIESVIIKSSDITRSRNAKTLSTAHIKHTILSEKRFDFLQDLVANIPDVAQGEEEGEGLTSPPEPRAVRPPKAPRPEGSKPRGRPRKVRPEGEGPSPTPTKQPKKRRKRENGEQEEDDEETDSAPEEPADSEEGEEEEEEEDDEDDEHQTIHQDSEDTDDAMQGTSHSHPPLNDRLTAMDQPSTSMGWAQTSAEQTQVTNDKGLDQATVSSPAPSMREESLEPTDLSSRKSGSNKETKDLPNTHHSETRTPALPGYPVPPPSGYFPGVYPGHPSFYGNPHFMGPAGNVPVSASQNGPTPSSCVEDGNNSNKSSEGTAENSVNHNKNNNNNNSNNNNNASVAHMSSGAVPTSSAPYGMFPHGFYPFPGLPPTHTMPPYMAPFHPAMMRFPPMALPNMGPPHRNPLTGSDTLPSQGIVPPFAQHMPPMMDPRLGMAGMNPMASTAASLPSAPTDLSTSAGSSVHPLPVVVSSPSGKKLSASQATRRASNDANDYDS